MRPNELRALLRSDVDFETGVIHVTKAWDFQNDKPKPYPKTAAGVRKLPIEPELVPLLEKLCAGLKRSDHVFPRLPPREDWAATFRMHLKRAGIERESLYDAVRLRATGFTWRTLRGDNTRKIQREAGHEDYNTTDGYVRDAAVYGTRLGQVFPALPEVFRSRFLITGCQDSRIGLFSAENERPQGDSNVVRPRLFSTFP